ncbi:DMT family transporter [Mycetocola sp. 2940]|uniref:DMT family transporter n=1 Tax=Mycetocola sp. 2940 TaxID=3156452 RepID=UPI00339ABF96
MTAGAAAQPRPALVAVQFGIIVVVFGSSFALTHLALEDVSAVQLGLVRLAIGTAVIGLLVAVTRQRLPRRPRVYLHFLVFGTIGVGIPPFAFGLAQYEIPSSIVAIYNSASPIATAMLTLAVLRAERFTVLRIVGIAFGFAAVVLLVSPWDSAGSSAPLIYHLLCVAAPVGFAASVVYFQVFLTPQRIEPLTSAFLASAAALLVALPLIPLALSPVGISGPGTIVVIVILGVVASGLGAVANIGVLNAWGPIALTTTAYLIPVVALTIGVALLGERLRWTDPVAAVVILASVLLVQRPSRPDAPVT